MEYNLITNIESCYVDIPNILYYSHIPTAIVVLLFGIFFLFKNKDNKLASIILFLISIIFSIWSVADLFLWHTYNSISMMTVWSLFGILYVLMFTLSLYFLYVFIEKRDISINKKITFFLMLLPSLLLTPTKYNLSSFDIANCQPIEGIYFNTYQYFVGFFIIAWIITLIYKSYKKATSERKVPILLVGLGILFFLVAFSWSEISGSVTENFEITQYGLFGAPVFIGFLVYSIVKFRAFNIKLVAAQALVWGLIALIGSQFFFIKSNTNMILNSVTFVGIIIFGSNLIKSVKREVEQREILEHITQELSDANEKLKGLDKLKTEFVSLASHQLRSPLTAIKGYVSMLSEGDYGEVPEEAKGAISRIFMSCQNLTKVVEDLLDVTKIEQGGMKYVMAPFNLVEVANDMAKDLSIAAKNKGLELNYVSDPSAICTVNGDKEKIRQVILNLIDNSIKYTLVGKIDISVKSENGKTLFSVSDTGVGMNEQVKASLFQKFARGDGAKINTSGSGLGLYLAKEIVEAHKGKVWVESEGLNKGSTFKMELDSL